MNKEMYMQVVWFKTILFYSVDLNKISLMPISYLIDEVQFFCRFKMN